MQASREHRGELAREEQERLEAHPARDLGERRPEPLGARREPLPAARPLHHRAQAHHEPALLPEAQDQGALALRLGAPPAQHAPRVGDLVLEDRHGSQSWSATTAITSSSVVSPWATRRKPAVRRVIMPPSAADRRMVSASTPSITMRRTPALMPNTS